MENDTRSFALQQHSWKSVFGLSTSSSGGAKDKYIDFPYIFAMVKTKIACGKGYSFATKDKQLEAFFTKFSKDSRLLEKITLLLFNIYYFGSAIGGFDKLKSGEDYRMYAISQKTFRPYISKVYEDIIGVSTLKEVVLSTNRKLYIRERWNMDKVQRTYWYDNQALTTLGYNSPVPKEYVFPLEEPNPFKQFKVIPFQDFPNYTFSDKPDWYPVRNYFPVFNAKVDYLLRELKLNRSRLALILTPKQKIATEKRIAEGKNVLDDYIINVGSRTEGQKLAEQLPSTILITNICTEIANHIKELFSLSGLSYNNTIESPLRTATEITTSNSSLSHTITQSQRAFNENFSLLLEKVFKVAGFSNPDFSFALTENTAIDQTTILNETILALNNGLISREKAIGTIFNLDDQEARVELQKVEDEYNEFNEVGQNAATGPVNGKEKQSNETDDS